MDKQRINQHSRPALGKGLASLIPTTGASAPTSTIVENTPAAGVPQEPESSRDRHPGISMCAIEDIVPNEYQPRRSFQEESIAELAQSIKANGLIQPLIVRKMSKGYQLIAGERRWRAAQLAGLKHVPIVIRRTTDREALELALIENIQREELNCFDTALAYYQLIHDFDLRQEDLSERVGKDRTTIANHLRLLKLPQSVQTALKEGRLSFGHGKALAGLENTTLLERLAAEAIEKKWSVRELENQIQKIKNLQQGQKGQNAEGQAVQIDPLQLRLRNLSRDLSKKFSTKVNLRGNETRGKITIEYFNGEDLERVLEQLLR